MLYKGGPGKYKITELFKILTGGKEQTRNIQFVRLNKTPG